MKIVTMNGRGVVVPEPEELCRRLGEKANIVGLAEAAMSKMVVLDIRHSQKVSAGKAGRDWLVLGKGFNKFSTVEVPTIQVEAGFAAGDVRSAFREGLKRPAKVKGLKMVGGIFNSSAGYSQFRIK